MTAQIVFRCDGPGCTVESRGPPVRAHEMQRVEPPQQFGPVQNAWLEFEGKHFHNYACLAAYAQASQDAIDRTKEATK